MNIFELVGKIVLEGVENAERQLNSLEGYVKKNEKAFKAVGTAMTGFGIAITGALVMSIKAAATEEAGIIKLTQALKNVGVAYDDVKDSLEANITATQQKTSIADDRQREALQRLLEVTGDYKKSLDLLPLALDLAAAKGMDAATASTIVGRVAVGNTAILTRYGIQLKEGATAVEALGALHAKFGGQAEAYGQSMAGQFDLIKNNISDVMEAIGSTVLPVLSDLFKNHIQPLILRLKEWADAHPALVKQLVILGGVLGGLATVIGPLLIMLPTLVASFTLLVGPVGLVSLAIGGLAAEIIWLIMNMKKMQHFWDDVWSNIKEITYKAVNTMLGYFKTLLGWIPVLGDRIEEARKKIEGMIRSEQVQRQIRNISSAIKENTEALNNNAIAIEDVTIQTNTLSEILSSQQDILKQTEDSIDALSDSYTKLSEESEKAKDNIGGWHPGIEIETTPWGQIVGPGYGEQIVSIPEEGIYGTRAELWAKGFLDEWLNERIRYWAPDIPSYQHGGLIREDTLLMGLKSMRPYALAHEGEEISPKGGQTANIIIMLDGKVIARAMGQPLVDEIRIKTGAKI